MFMWLRPIIETVPKNVALLYMTSLGGGVQGISPKPTILGHKKGEEVAARRVVRMSWTGANTDGRYTAVRNVAGTGRTASASDYARFKRERATLRNYNDNSL